MAYDKSWGEDGGDIKANKTLLSCVSEALGFKLWNLM